MAFNFEYFKKFDFGSVLKFATIDLLKQKNFLKESGFLSVLFFLILLLIGLFLFAIISAAYLFITPELAIFTFVPLIFALIFFVLFFWSIMYFSYKLIAFALASTNRKVTPFSFGLAVKLFLSGIYSFIVSVFCLYEIKFLLIGIVGFILFFVGFGIIILFNANSVALIFGFLFLLIAFLLIFVYYIMVIRNSVRVSFSSLVLVEKDLGIIESVKYSWNFTAGKAVLIFFIQLILGGIMWVVQQLFMVVLNMAVFLFGIVFNESFFLIILVPLVIVLLVIFMVLIVISELVVIFGITKTYSQIAQNPSKAQNKRK